MVLPKEKDFWKTLMFSKNIDLIIRKQEKKYNFVVC